MPNKDNVEIEKILPLAAIGGAIAGAAGSAAGALGRMAAGAGKGGGGEDESEGLDEQDSHAQTEWENIHRSKSMQKLMNFVQIQKLGYAEDDRRKRPVPNRRGGGWNTRHELGSQSAGLPAHGSKEWDKLKDIWEKTREGQPGGPDVYPDSLNSDKFPLDVAHQYLGHIQDGEDPYAEASMLDHLDGHQAIADVHNMMQFGDEWQLHPDRLEYMVPTHYDQITRGKFMGEDGWTNMGEGIQRPSKQFVDRMIQGRGNAWHQKLPFEIFQQEVLPAVVSPEVSNQAKGMMDDLHRRIRMESSQYNPNDMRFPKLQSPRGAYDEDFGPERRTYHSEATPLPGQGEPSDAVGAWYDDDYDRNKRKFRGDDDDESSSGAHPFENFPYTETGEVGSDPDNYGIARRGINQGQLGRKDFDAIYGNPTRYGYDDSEGAETLPDEQLTQYPSAEARHAVYGKPVDDSRKPPQVPPPIPGDDLPEPPFGNPAARNAFERNFRDLYDEEKAVSKLVKFMRKEGAVGGEGGGFDGLSDTVFTSTNAGIFTPTYGGKGTKKKHRKNERRQDKKRQKLMGKEKKSGVERLVQYLYDGSPHISKARKMGLAPGLDDDMTGNAPTAHAGNNRTHSPHVPVENSSDLNHKRTSRKLEDAMEVARENEPHISMGQPGGFETGRTATIPPQHSNVNAVGNAKVQPGPNWGKHKSYVQKAEFLDKSGKKAREERKAAREQGQTKIDRAKIEGILPQLAEFTAAIDHPDNQDAPDEKISPASRHLIFTHKQSVAGKDSNKMREATGACLANAHYTLAATHAANPNTNWKMVHGHVRTGDTDVLDRHAWLENHVTGKVHDPSIFDQFSTDRSATIPIQTYHAMREVVPAYTWTAQDYMDSIPHPDIPMNFDSSQIPEVIQKPNKGEVEDIPWPMQKAVPQATTFISPNGNTKAADGQHPQEAFIERTKDNPNEAPHKDAVIKENDMQRKRKQESNTEPEGSQPVAGLGLQMSSFGMNTYEQDSLARGGEEDVSQDEEKIDEDERVETREDEDGNTWIPMDTDRTKSLESMRKALEDAGDEAPLLTALHKLDYK